MSQWHLDNGETYLVTGEPVIVGDLTQLDLALDRAAAGRRAARDGLRLEPDLQGRARACCRSAIALLAAALTFGALALSGASLTMASVAVLPVLVGLSVDYAIQFQSRVQEAAQAGARDALDAVRDGRLAARRRSPRPRSPASAGCSC